MVTKLLFYPFQFQLIYAFFHKGSHTHIVIRRSHAPTLKFGRFSLFFFQVILPALFVFLKFYFNAFVILLIPNNAAYMVQLHLGEMELKFRQGGHFALCHCLIHQVIIQLVSGVTQFSLYTKITVGISVTDACTAEKENCATDDFCDKSFLFI